MDSRLLPHHMCLGEHHHNNSPAPDRQEPTSTIWGTVSEEGAGVGAGGGLSTAVTQAGGSNGLVPTCPPCDSPGGDKRMRESEG